MVATKTTAFSKLIPAIVFSMALVAGTFLPEIARYFIDFNSMSSSTRIICVIVLVPLSALIIVLLHELGHALTAWQRGYQVHAIVVGAFGFSPARSRFFLNKDRTVFSLSGYVLASAQLQNLNPQNEKWVVAGGNLATGFLAAIALVFAIGFNFEGWGRMSLAFLYIFGLMTIAGLLPYESRSGQKNDASNFLALTKNPECVINYWAGTRFLAVHAGHRSELMNDEEWEIFKTMNDDHFNENAQLVMLIEAWRRSETKIYEYYSGLLDIDLDDRRETGLNN